MGEASCARTFLSVSRTAALRSMTKINVSSGRIAFRTIRRGFEIRKIIGRGTDSSISLADKERRD